MLKRFMDLILSLIALILLSPVFLLAFLMVKLTSKGPAIYWSKRVGKNNDLFLMPKFRTMKIDTPQVATHLLTNPDSYLIPTGSFLRKTSIDELPQIYSVLVGDMSIVGPRPALYNQDDLIQLRTEKGVHLLSPGITGWAQINGRDELPIPVKVDFDQYYLKNKSMILDLQIILQTAIKVLGKHGVSH